MTDLSAETFLTEEELHRVRTAIAAAERETSGEMRVHLEDHCEDEIMDHAAYVFDALDMHRTRERNAALVYVSVLDRQVAVLGDAGIHAVVGQGFWDDVLELIRLHFIGGRYAEGLIAGIERIGEKLRAHFPPRADDRDELTNEISIDR